MILESQDNLIPPDIPQEEVEQETVQEEESSPNIFGHLSNSIFQDNFETVHPYNTRSKTASKPSTENTLEPNTLYLNTRRKGFLSSILIRNR